MKLPKIKGSVTASWGTMKYQIKDRQFEYERLFADGEIFKSKREAIAQLRDYHSIDMEVKKMTDEQVLYFGGWELVRV